MSLAIEAFVDNVRSFCEWVEVKDHDPLKARQLLLSLMSGIPYLTVSETRKYEAPQYPRRTHDDWKSLHAHFANLPFQYYRQVFDPLKMDNDEPVTGDIHDDLADIYDELWHGLQALMAGDGIYAVEYWRHSYVHHWGHHAACALGAIDQYYRGELGARSEA